MGNQINWDNGPQIREDFKATLETTQQALVSQSDWPSALLLSTPFTPADVFEALLVAWGSAVSIEISCAPSTVERVTRRCSSQLYAPSDGFR
eukprot:scaffold391_cov189-Alexandrium_tamarense.AAC.15